MFRIGSLGKPEKPFGPGKDCCSKLILSVGSITTPAAAVTMTTIVWKKGAVFGKRGQEPIAGTAGRVLRTIGS